MIKKIIYLIAVLTSISSFAQKKLINHKMYDSWNHIASYNLSNNGNYVYYRQAPYKGDGILFLKNILNKKTIEIQRAYNASFASDESFFVCKIKPQSDSLRKQKLKKTKKEDLLKDSLLVVNLNNNEQYRFKNVKKYKISKNNSKTVFIHFYKEKTPADTSKKDSTAKKTKIKYKGGNMLLFSPYNADSVVFNNVSNWTVDDDNKSLFYAVSFKDSLDSIKIYYYNIASKKNKLIFNNYGRIKNLECSSDGEKLAFLYSGDTAKPYIYNLYYFNIQDDNAKLLADTSNKNIYAAYDFSPDFSLYFSKNGNRLFAGIRPKPQKEPKDTLLDEEKCSVDVWSWTDNYLMPQQLKRLNRDKKHSFICVYDFSQNKLIQLADSLHKKVKIYDKGNADWGLFVDNEKYVKQLSWTTPYPYDFWLVNINTGEKIPVMQNKLAEMSISPAQKYVYWYSYTDSAWFAKNIKSNKIVNLTGNLSVCFYNEDNEVPALPDSYGNAGWSENDEYFYIYDKYDIWKIPVETPENAKRITAGRKNKEIFRYKKLNNESIFVEDTMILTYFNKTNKKSGYYKYINNNNKLSKLLVDDYKFFGLKKAKNAEKYLLRKMSFTHYPDIFFTSDFKKLKQISNANPQQKEYNWGSVELCSWKSYNNDSLSGLIYKPENFDPNKKYPVIVYFYEKYSDDLHNYYSPKPIRSVINFTYYVSNGYIVFIPDIKYHTGTPGKDAYNAVVSGTEFLMQNKWVDRKHIAIQGQSWGGYQVAYLVTQTNLYACAMAGAPVSNMTSAYGGIRWASGMSRMFQYEKTQSRIGGTLWNSRRLYIENSPVFFADRVQTPLLIMHNDGDGAVPWYQGIEYFVALRRLNKPVWLLNYNNDQHNLRRKPNMLDLTIRMSQFFDHYLKGKEMPDWMKHGVPALQKNKKTGLQLLEK